AQYHGNSRSQALYPGGLVATRPVSRQLEVTGSVSRGTRSYTPSITATRGHRLCIQGDS
ncbi:hypothetical protein RRG08_013983, partial [Elysia crispata]